jgi:hypothetical protein
MLLVIGEKSVYTTSSFGSVGYTRVLEPGKTGFWVIFEGYRNFARLLARWRPPSCLGRQSLEGLCILEVLPLDVPRAFEFAKFP